MKRIYVGDFKIGTDEKKVVNDVLDSGRISEGLDVRNFEIKFAEYIGTKYAVATNSGTSALIAGMIAMKNHPDLSIDENTNVITTPLTCVATSNVLVNTGFNPVYVDIDPDTFCITPENIKEHLEQVDDVSTYSFILPVHLMGYACDMHDINKIAKNMVCRHLKIRPRHTEQNIKVKKPDHYHF